MKYKKIVRLYSHSRINKYYKAVNYDKSRAVSLYYANMKVAQAFHPLLSSFEVILRNQIHYAIANLYADSNWIINQKVGFMVSPTLTYVNKKSGKRTVNDYILRQVEDAEHKILKRGVCVTASGLIAEQTLGFWNAFYEVHHYSLLKGAPGRIFSKLPSGYGRKQVNDAIIRIRELRNRINHNEPICFVNEKCDFSYVRQMYALISDFLSWIDPDIMYSLIEVDRVLKVIDKEEHKFIV